MTILETLPPLEDEDHGGVVVRLDADLEGLFAHWEPGTTWGTTANDELGDCVHHDGSADAPRAWSRQGTAAPRS